MDVWTIVIPVLLNDRSPNVYIPWWEQSLLEACGGFTVTDGTGVWKGQNQRYDEPVKVYTVAGDVPRALLEDAKVTMDQEALFCSVRKQEVMFI